MSHDGPTLRALLLGAFEAGPASLGVVGRLSPFFREKQVHGRLLAEVISHLPLLHTHLAAGGGPEPHWLDGRPMAELNAHQFRTLLAHHYRQTIRRMEGETWLEELARGPDQTFYQHFRERRERELVEMAATMVELETGSPLASRIAAPQADWERLRLEMKRLSAEKKIVLRSAENRDGQRDVIFRVRMAFIFALLEVEGRSQNSNTLLGFLHQLQDLEQSGLEEEHIARLWLLPSEIPHTKVEQEEAEAARYLDFTSLQAIVCRWRDLLLASHAEAVGCQLRAGNWNRALGLLKGHPQLCVELKDQLLEIIRLQMPFGERVETASEVERIRLPLGMEVVASHGEAAMQRAVGVEILMRLGSKAGYGLIFPWQNGCRAKRCLQIGDQDPEKVPRNGNGHDLAVEMALLRVFGQVWGVEERPTAGDVDQPEPWLQRTPRRIEVRRETVLEIRAGLDLNRVSVALSRVEQVLDKLTPLLPDGPGEAVRRNVGGLRQLMKKAGAKRANDVPSPSVPATPAT